MTVVNTAHTDKYDVSYYRSDDGKYVVGEKVNNGNMGACLSVYDTAEEANARLKELGVEGSLFLDPDAYKPELIKGGQYSHAVGDVTGAITKYSFLNLVTDGKYSEAASDVAEKMARASGINLIEQAISNVESTPYSEGAGKVAKWLTQYSLLDLATKGKYSDAASETAEKISRFSLTSIVHRMFN